VTWWGEPGETEACLYD